MAPDPVAPAGADPTVALVGALNGGRYRRWKEVAGYAIVAWTLGMKGYARARTFQQARSFSVTVCDLDDIYVDVQRWLLDRIPDEERRGLMASSHKGRLPSRPPGFGGGEQDCMPADEPGHRQKPRRQVHLTYDGTKAQVVDMNGHAVTVTSEKRTWGDADKGNYGDPAKITFTATNRAGQRAAVAFLQEVADAFEAARSDNAADIWIGTRWGDWQRVREIPPRPLTSVVLAGDLRDQLVDDLERFLADEEIYVRLGLPYHRGILLHGPAGTGKTSVAKVLAGHLGLDIYCLPLSSMKEDTDIGRMLANVGPRSMLLIEDIDVVHAAKDRDSTDEVVGGVTLTGLLNALDGVATPHGSIVLMTTNRLEVLDAALRRPGRADLTVLIDYLDDEQMGRLFQAIYGPTQVGTIPWLGGRRVSPAEVVEVLKPHLRDPSAGLEALVRFMASDPVPVHE